MSSLSHASPGLSAMEATPSNFICSVAIVALLPVVGRFLANSCQRICAAKSEAGAETSDIMEQEDETFHLVLHKSDGERLGFVIRPTGDGFRVEYVNGEGVLARWNAEHPKLAVRAGDIVLSLNDESERTGLVMEAWNASVIRMTVQRSRYGGWNPPDPRLFYAKASVNDYPRVKGADLEDKECAICLEAFTSDSFGVSLPCKHCFHQSCLSRWLADTNTCPCCRLDLPLFDYANEQHTLADSA